MNSRWLKDDTVTLRSPEPEDLELMYAMENDTTLWSAGNATLPYSRYSICTDGYDTVVYDTDAYSYSTILRLLAGTEGKRMKLGTYSPQTRTLITEGAVHSIENDNEQQMA